MKDEIKEINIPVNVLGAKCYLTTHSKIIADEINKIIDYINKEK